MRTGRVASSGGGDNFQGDSNDHFGERKLVGSGGDIGFGSGGGFGGGDDGGGYGGSGGGGGFGDGNAGANDSEEIWG